MLLGAGPCVLWLLCFLQLLELGCKPSQGEDSVALGLACMSESAYSTCAPVTARGLSWSPTGCTPTGSCLLAVVSSDGKVRVLECVREGGGQQ